MAKWNHHESESLYNVTNWGRGFFRINAQGHVEVLPDGNEQGPAVDLYDLQCW